MGYAIVFELSLIYKNQIWSFTDFHHLDDNDPFLNSIKSVLTQWFNTNETMELNTSGSTGAPKTISLSKKAMRESARKTINFFNLKKGDKALLCLPVKFIGGMMMLIRAIEQGLDLHIDHPSLRPLRGYDESFDFIPMTPAQMMQSFLHDSGHLHNQKKILLGGAPISITLENAIHNSSLDVYHSFGMTETISHIALRELKAKDRVFNALPGVQFSKDQRSCLVIDADHLNQSIITNDIVEIISKTAFIWQGRWDNVVNSGGVKLHPELIEEKLKSMMSKDFFLIGKNDEQFGEVLVLVYEGDDSHEASINALCKRYLSKFEQPKALLNISNFLRTETGKIRRSETYNLALRSTK